MTIRIINEPDIAITAEQYARYKQEYDKRYSMYCGPLPTLEEYIRSRIEMEKLHRAGSGT